AAGAEDDDGHPLLDSPLQRARDLLSVHAAHRAAHKVEVADGGGDLDAVQPGDAAHGAVGHAELALGGLVLLKIIREVKGVLRTQAGVPQLEAVIVKGEFGPLLPSQPMMVAARGADFAVCNEFCKEQCPPAFDALYEALARLDF